jgi:hypothetical protein
VKRTPRTSLVGCDGGGIEARELETAVAVGRAHHGDLDALAAQAGDAPGPFAFDRGPPLKLEAKFGEKRNRGIQVLDHDADVVHTFDGHDISLTSNIQS